MDTASILKRFFYCEQSLIISQAGWLVSVAPFEIKMALPRIFWEDAMTAHALRERVFELHYPSRLMQIGEDAVLIGIIQEAANAPGVEAFILSLARVFKPAQLAAYRQYLAEGDEIADGPTLRFMRIAVQEKEQQVVLLTRFADELLAVAPERRPEAEAWVAALDKKLAQVGGISLDAALTPAGDVPLPGRRLFKRSDAPVRDPRFYRCRFYWPDMIDPNFPYGEGLSLQLRSAVSHINEVWAVDAAGTSLNAFAETLGWEFIFEAARWTYDETRHCRMGHNRLHQWGFEDNEIPLGTYIYDSARGQEPIYLLGMLSYFETKNIGKKTQRAKAFAEFNDYLSQHDMEFDWADETIHANYGAHWIGALREAEPDAVPDFNELRDQCNELVDAIIATATDQERADIRKVAQAMIQKAEKLAAR
jgi:hypothetical protein